MDEEKLNRQMQFIVNQQAQFSADIQILQESQQRMSEAMEKNRKDADARLTRLEDIVTRLANASFDRISKLEESHVALAEAQRVSEERIAHLTESQTILIDMFERFIRREQERDKRN